VISPLAVLFSVGCDFPSMGVSNIVFSVMGAIISWRIRIRFHHTP
jgi:hypothetical protein